MARKKNHHLINHYKWHQCHGSAPVSLVWRLLAGAIGDPLGASAAGDLFNGRHELVADDAHLTERKALGNHRGFFLNLGGIIDGDFTHKKTTKVLGNIRDIIGVQ